MDLSFEALIMVFLHLIEEKSRFFGRVWHRETSQTEKGKEKESEIRRQCKGQKTSSKKDPTGGSNTRKFFYFFIFFFYF